MKIGLVLNRSAKYRKVILAAFSRAEMEYSVSAVGRLAKPGRGENWDVLVLDGTARGVLPGIKAREFDLPIVLLVDKKLERQAVDLLEHGAIADYALTARGQLERLPQVVRAALARAGQAGPRSKAGVQNSSPERKEILQEAVFQIARAADEAETLDSLLPRIHEIVGTVMPARNFYIALHNPARDSFTFVYFVDEVDELTTPEVSLGSGLTPYVLRTGKSLLVNNDEQRVMLREAGVDQSGTPSAIWLGVPLIVDKVPIGVMAVQHYQDSAAYGETEQRILEFVSAQAAMVIRRKQIYDALRTSEESFRSAFEKASVGISRSTPDGQIIYANPALVRMLGFESLEELSRRNRSNEGLVNGYHRRDFIEQIEKDGEVRGFESIWRRADGSQIYVRESARAVRGIDGRPVYYEGIVEDITDRKRAESAVDEKVRALESLAEIDREILAAEDAQSILHLVCERIASLLRAPRSAILTKESSSGQLILAAYGFSNPQDLSIDFEKAIEMGLLAHTTALSISDVGTASSYLSELIAREHIRSVVVENFSSTADLQGALLVFDTEPRTWSEDEVQLVRLLAGQAALALAKIGLLTDARRRANQFSGLYEIAVELMASRDLPLQLSMIVQKASELHHVPSAFIYLYDEKTETLDLSIVTGIDIRRPVRPKLGEGMVGRVAQSRQFLMVDDYSAWPHHLDALVHSRFAAVLEVPMLYQGQLIGVLGIAEIDDSRRRFSEEDVRLLSFFAEQAAGALYNSGLFAQIEERNKEQDRLARASAALLESMSGDPKTVCASIAMLLASEFNFSNCSIWLIKENSILLERGAVAGPFVDEFHSTSLSLDGEGIIAKSVRTGEIINLPNVLDSPVYVEGWEKTRSELVVPLRTGERILGAIDLQSDELSAYSLDDQRLIDLIASRAALMLEHVRLYQQTERRLGQLTVLSNIDAAIASSLDLQVTLNLLVAQLSTHLQADAVAALLLNPHLQMLEYAAGRGFRGQGIRRIPLLLGEDQAGVAALERRIVRVADVSSPEVVLSHPERIAGEKFVTMFAMPLIAKGQVRGVLEVYFRRLVESDPEWTHFLEILARQAAVAVEDARLFNEMQRSYTELAVAYDAAIEGWSRIIRLRQRESEETLRRLTDLTLDLARRMGIPEAEIANIYRGVLLHDIGKLAVPESILYKTSPLTDEEWEVLHRHPVFAHELLQNIPYLRASVSIPYCHQENWDGSGYPRGLKGEEIPLEARIFAVVNAWLRMQMDRPYAQAADSKTATEQLQKQAGAEFDPKVVEVFCELLEEQKSNPDPDLLRVS